MGTLRLIVISVAFVAVFYACSTVYMHSQASETRKMNFVQATKILRQVAHDHQQFAKPRPRPPSSSETTTRNLTPGPSGDVERNSEATIPGANEVAHSATSAEEHPQAEDEIKEQPFVPSVSEQDAQERMNKQCSGTSGERNRIDGMPKLNIPKEKYDFATKWPNFSPSKEDVKNSVDMRAIMDGVEPGFPPQWWEDFKSGSLPESELDKKKLEINSKGPCLNKHLTPKEGHLPILLRVMERTETLEKVIEGLSKVDGISGAMLIVTVDGGKFENVIKLLLERVTFVKTRIYFHAFTEDQKNMGFSANNLAARLNSHVLYDMRLSMDIMGYPYMITLEDDLLPGPDFYLHHLNLYKETNKDEVFAIATQAHGPYLDCHYIKSILMGTGECNSRSTNVLTREKWYPNWGAGLNRKLLDELYWGFFKFPNDIYDGILVQLAGDRYSLSPCSPRVKYIPNEGVNGAGSARWDNDIDMIRVRDHSKYTVINEESESKKLIVPV